ncbi:MAG: hypothetical protein IJO68_05190 [Clostridia bacterium]|nr:hypothetical protein [Clostridia bacterium]
MTKFKKIISAILLSCMLLIPVSAAVTASAMDGINAFFQIAGIDLSDPESIQEAIDKISEGGLSGLAGIFGADISDIMDELSKYLQVQVPTTAPVETTTEEETTEEESTTEEPTTEEPTTRKPVYTPPTSYSPPTYTPPATLPPETTTFTYIPPEQIYTEAFTTTVFNPVIEDDTSAIKDDTNPIKTALGVILLVGSGVGVIVVVLALKRNRI